jgi:hypothetical protein
MSAEFGQGPRQRALSASGLDERCVGIVVHEELKLFLGISLPTAAEGVIKLDRADHFGIVDLL